MERKLRALWKLVFGDSEEFLDGFFQKGFSFDRCRYVTDGDSVTAALHWLDCEYRGEKYAYLYAVATHPDYRNRGLCRELMAKTHADLKEQGYAGAVLVPQEESLRTFYGKMGYENMGNMDEFAAVSGEKPASLRKIVAQEYAALRRKHLPEEGLLQEGAGLDFLDTYAAFYAGEDFLLAAFREEAHLWGMELLGNRERAPGILKALGCLRGRFRTPGEESPFGMFLPLKEDAPVPKYLGHAFD